MLVIRDQDMAVRHTLGLLFNNQKSFHVLTAGTAAETLQRLEQAEPSIVIGDWVLPPMTGTDMVNFVLGTRLKPAELVFTERPAALYDAFAAD